MHYNKQKKCMTVHYKKTCYVCKNVICNAKVETKYNKTQPNLVLQGFSSGGLGIFGGKKNLTIVINK